MSKVGAPPEHSESSPGLVSMGPRGMRITHSPVRLSLSPRSTPKSQLRYNTSVLLQLAPGRAALVVGREQVGGGTLDFAAGAEIIPFNDLEAIDPASGTVLADNETIDHPETGERILMQKFPPSGGFVPLGAKLADGSDHPHAGTGFLILYAQGVPEDILNGKRDGYSGTWAAEAGIHRRFELYQLTYDGKRLSIKGRSCHGFKELLPGFTLFNRGLTTAVPVGPDLLFSMQGGGADLDERQIAKNVQSGAMRWTRDQDGNWKPVDFHPITGEINGYETSIVRVGDGSLFATARQTGRDVPEKFSIFLWRSTDEGKTWQKELEAPRRRADSPIALGLANDGTLFLAGNLLTGPLHSKGSLGYWRAISTLWPVSLGEPPELEMPVIHRCAPLEWGPSATNSGWGVDHLIPGRAHLRDNRWHSLISYRALDRGENNGKLPPTPHSGHYLDEIFTEQDSAAPPWLF